MFQEANVQFDAFTSPRFGPVKMLRSTNLIQKGEEICVDYKYNMGDEDTPFWYRKQHHRSFGTLHNSRSKKIEERERKNKMGNSYNIKK
jgi:hypothetical protein